MQLKPLHKCFPERKLQQKFSQIFHYVTPNSKRMCTRELRVTINVNLTFNNMGIINNFYLTTRTFLRKIGILKLYVVVQKKNDYGHHYCHSLNHAKKQAILTISANVKAMDKAMADRHSMRERTPGRLYAHQGARQTKGSIPQPQDPI